MYALLRLAVRFVHSKYFSELCLVVFRFQHPIGNLRAATFL
jgi:hypothetical protein